VAWRGGKLICSCKCSRKLAADGAREANFWIGTLFGFGRTFGFIRLGQ